MGFTDFFELCLSTTDVPSQLLALSSLLAAGYMSLLISPIPSRHLLSAKSIVEFWFAIYMSIFGVNDKDFGLLLATSARAESSKKRHISDVSKRLQVPSKEIFDPLLETRLMFIT